MSGTQKPRLSRFERIALVFGIRSKPTGLVYASELMPLAGRSRAARQVVKAYLARLESRGLIETKMSANGRLQYRRTPAGIRIGVRLLKDHRRSFAWSMPSGVIREEEL